VFLLNSRRSQFVPFYSFTIKFSFSQSYRNKLQSSLNILILYALGHLS